MKINRNVKIMTIAGLLSALGIIIPMFAPKIPIPPASYTLASHVPIFIAMFISPPIAIFVSLITTFGFFISGWPIAIVFRALTHIIFATAGAYVLKKNSAILREPMKTGVFAVLISFLHAAAEVIVITYLYFYQGEELSTLFYEKGFLITVVGLVGLGGFIHSLIDFTIALYVWKPLKQIVASPKYTNSK